jgi:hypothetical protein
MAVKFTPKTAGEIEAEKAKFLPWPKGAYDFEVAAAEDATSKAGNEMIVLELQVFDQNGNRRQMKDWLLETLPVKLKHACEAVGLHAAYENGNISSYDFVGRTGRLTLGIERQSGYEDRNKVLGYIPADEVVTRQISPAAARPIPPRQKTPAGDIDDEIPF